LGRYATDKVTRGSITYFLIRDTSTGELVKLPTKYLKHHRNMNHSDSTIRGHALAVCWYYNYMEQESLSIQKVLHISYSEQQEHFINFLYWVQAGRHTDNGKRVCNNTANDYLKKIFAYYEYLILELESLPDLKVLDDLTIGYSTDIGLRYKRNVKTFKGYLPSNTVKSESIATDDLKALLQACTSKRNKLLLLLLEETGLRIGELLGVRYTKDIDYENHKIFVRYRRNNENHAHQKYAEERGLLISPNTFTLLEIYLAEYADLLKDTDYLFVAEYGPTKGKPLSVSSVYTIFNTLKKKSGVKSHPHQFRHFFANERRKAGWEISLISTSLGHRSIATTETYLNVEDEEMVNASTDYYKQTQSLIDIDAFL
jgi:integrase/recombinase XerD